MDKIAQFSIIKEIGKGGFGTVYLAHDLEINEYVALKKIENYKERKHEIKGIQKFKKSREFFKKENIISIYDTIKHGDDFYYSMPIADGMAGMVCTDIKYVPKTLDLLIKEKKQEGGWFSKDEILDIVLPIAKALKTIDSCGLKHRDVKPANIVFVKNQPVLSDFGMLVDDNSAMSNCGTFDYAPPEWFLNSGGDPDMWGFAMTFFSLFSGRSPSESRKAKKYPGGWTETDKINNKETWDKFYKIVFRIKEGKEKDRFPSWQSLCDELESISQNRQITPSKPKRKHLFYILFVIGFTLTAFLFFLIDMDDIESPYSEKKTNTKEVDTSVKNKQSKEMSFSELWEAPDSPKKYKENLFKVYNYYTSNLIEVQKKYITEMGNLDVKISDGQSENSTLKEHISSLEVQIKNLKELSDVRQEKFEAKIKEYKEEEKKLRDEASKNQDKLNKLTGECQKTERELKASKEKIENLQKDLNEKNKEIEKLKESIALYKEDLIYHNEKISMLAEYNNTQTKDDLKNETYLENKSTPSDYTSNEEMSEYILNYQIKFPHSFIKDFPFETLANIARFTENDKNPIMRNVFFRRPKSKRFSNVNSRNTEETSLGKSGIMPLREAIDAICKKYDLTYEVKPNIPQNYYNSTRYIHEIHFFDKQEK